MAISGFLSSWVPVALWAWGIFFLSSIPSLNSGLGIWDFILRKIAHVTEFAILTVLLIRGLYRTWPAAARKKLIAIAGSLSFLYAVSDEFHQSFVPGRTPSFHDVMIDSIGIVVIVYLAWSRP